MNTEIIHRYYTRLHYTPTLHPKRNLLHPVIYE